MIGWFTLCLAVLSPWSGPSQTALQNGGNQDGMLAAGATDSYTATAGAGGRLVVQLAKLSGGAAFTPLLEMFAPDGTRLAASADGVAARLDIQAAVGGTYAVTVRDANGTGSGNYRLRLAQVPEALAVPAGDDGGMLTNGVAHQGTIELGDLDLWTVPGSVGDRITVQLSELSGGAGFTPFLEVFTPDGRLAVSHSDGLAARVDLQATVEGTYTVLVSDLQRTGAGTYQVQLAQVPAGFTVPAGDEGGALADETDTDGTISLGDLDLWSFNASAGDRLTVQITELTGGAGFAPLLELFAPNGEVKAAAQGAIGATLDVAVESGGTHTLLVSDATRTGTGTYRLRLTRGSIGPSEADTLTNGSSSSGSVAEAGQTNRWTFTASAGENIVVRMGELASGAFIPWLRLYGPDGVLLGQHFSGVAAEVTARATNSGTFLVIVSDGSSGRNQTGNYRISLARTGGSMTISPGDEGGTLVSGTTYLASIDTGDIDAWTFTANAGESVAVRMGETTAGSTLLPWLRLYGPNGALLGQDFSGAAAEVTTRATNSGTFLVVAGDGNNGFGGTGNYRLSLAKTGSQPAISATDEGGTLVNGTTYLATIDTGDLDAWTIILNAGESIAVRMGETTAGSTLLPWLRLYGPNGALLNQDFSGAAAEVTTRATNSGTFLVVAGDGNNGFGGTGNYRLSLAKTGSQPVISATDEGGPLVNGTTYLATIDTGDIDAWTFTANAGENLLVRMGETVANSTLLPWLRLYGPNGALLGQDFSGAAAEVTTRATNSGTFLVVAGDGNNGFGGTGNYRLSLAKTGSALGISAGDEGGSMTGTEVYAGVIDTGDIDAWTFTVCAGDRITLNVTELVSGSPLVPWLRLYGRDGSLLRTVFGAANAGFSDFIAPASGTYQVVVSDGNNSLAGTGTYRLTANGLSDGLKLCPPALSGATAVLSGIGGPPGGSYVLLSTNDVAAPLRLWPAVRTNQFDTFGVMTFTNEFTPGEPRRFFTLQVP